MPVARLTVFKPMRFFAIADNCRKAIISIGLILFLGNSTVKGQVLQDSSSLMLVKTGIDFVYNFEFKKADRISLELEKLYPGHPIVYLFRGMITYWQNYPLTPTSEARQSFEDNMRKCIELCDKNKNHDYDAEILLANLCARGLLLLYFTENNLSFEVFPIASSTYQCIKRSFEFTSTYRDLFFFTGIYNYYREAYPEAHPIYKTLAFLFPKGSKEKGIADLQAVAKSSIILKAESFTFLTDIFLSFENNYQQAAFYSKSLHQLYPENPEYQGRYIKNLLLIRNYDEAERELSSAAGQNNIFFLAQSEIFKGIIEEKKYHNLREAEDYYNKGIRNISQFREYGNEYTAYAYFGLSRIAEKNGNDDNKKNYRKLALKLAVFKEITFD
jgi:hypothetical protein